MKPWEYYSYKPSDYYLTVNGYQYRNELYLDSVRWLATVQAKLAGAKKIKKPSDLMKLPLIDGKANSERLERMIDFLKKAKEPEG